MSNTLDDAEFFIQRTSTLNGINFLGKVLRKIGMDPFALDAQVILKSGLRKTNNAVNLPSSAYVGIEQLIASIQNDADLNPFGSLAFKTLLKRTVYQRLKIEQQFNLNPGLNEIAIKSPVFIIGMPRTGTTILHALLNEDRANRSPLSWECLLPYPVSTPENHRNNEQVKTVEKEFGQLFKLVPDFKKKHHMEADSPQECIGINFLDFNSFQPAAQAYIPSYMDWFMNKADKSSTMQWHKRFLQYLSSGGVESDRWLLKSPVHLIRLKEIFEVYPDAKIIMTHRHPNKVVASAASLISSVRSLYSDDEDPIRTGAEQAEFWSAAFNIFLEQRKELDKEDQIIDLKFDDFIQDQMGVVEQIYQRFSWNLSDASREAMRNFLNANPPGKHGTHEYTLEQFGLSEEKIEKQFKSYIEFINRL